MQLPLSDANTIQSPKLMPHTCHENDTAIAHEPLPPPSSAPDHSLTQANDQPLVPEIDQAALLDRVKQTIDDLESQGLLMLFDRHDRVAERLTDDLLAASTQSKDLAVDY